MQNTTEEDLEVVWNVIIASLLLRERHSFRRATAMIITNTFEDLGGNVHPIKRAR